MVVQEEAPIFARFEALDDESLIVVVFLPIFELIQMTTSSNWCKDLNCLRSMK